VTRLRDFGRDVAYYFGVGKGSERRPIPDEEPGPGAVVLNVFVGVVPVLVAAFLLKRVLDLDAK
jgi:hypothetical protein